MKPRASHKSDAFTRIELIVLIVASLVVGTPLVVWLGYRRNFKIEADKITCVNNLKWIGVAYRLWAEDHNDRFPASVSGADGGWKDTLTNAD